MNMKVAVFWVAVPCALVEVYERFRGFCCLLHEGEIAIFPVYISIFQLKVIFLICLHEYVKCS
jgi:hypothetical protein